MEGMDVCEAVLQGWWGSEVDPNGTRFQRALPVSHTDVHCPLAQLAAIPSSVGEFANAWAHILLTPSPFLMATWQQLFSFQGIIEIQNLLSLYHVPRSLGLVQSSISDHQINVCKHPAFGFQLQPARHHSLYFSVQYMKGFGIPCCVSLLLYGTTHSLLCCL